MITDPPPIVPILSDGRILLRLFKPEDAPAVYTAVIASAAELRPWMPWYHDAYSQSDTERFIDFARRTAEREKEFSFAIFSARSGEFLGSCGINRRDRENRSAFVGYWIRTDHAGQGIATAAACLVARFGFESLALERITIQAAVGNLGSQAVARKIGAQFEGIARSALRLGDRRHDVARYSLLPGELRESP